MYRGCERDARCCPCLALSLIPCLRLLTASVARAQAARAGAVGLFENLAEVRVLVEVASLGHLGHAHPARPQQLREISEDYDLYKMAAAAGIDAKSYALRQAPGLLEFSDNTADYLRVRRELVGALEKANRAKWPDLKTAN